MYLTLIIVSSGLSSRCNNVNKLLTLFFTSSCVLLFYSCFMRLLLQFRHGYITRFTVQYSTVQLFAVSGMLGCGFMPFYFNLIYSTVQYSTVQLFAVSGMWLHALLFWFNLIFRTWQWWYITNTIIKHYFDRRKASKTMKHENDHRPPPTWIPSCKYEFRLSTTR